MVASDLMRGTTLVRNQIITYLSVAVPELILVAREQWGLEDARLPMPLKYDVYEPTAEDAWPVCGVAVNRSRSWARVDYEPGTMAEDYRPIYTVRIITFVMSPMDENDFPIKPEFNVSMQARDDLSTIITAALLRQNSLGNQAFTLNESTLTEDFSEPRKAKGDRWIAGVVHDFDLQVDQQQFRESIGSADTISHEVARLPQ